MVKLLYKGFVTVATKQKIWCFPPIFLIHEDDLSTLPWPNPLTKADNLEALRSFLKQNPSQVCECVCVCVCVYMCVCVCVHVCVCVSGRKGP